MNPKLDRSGMSAQTEQILGIPFFNGTATKAVDYFLEVGGLLVAPALPALINLKYDLEYRRAMQAASVAVPDSMLLTVMWKGATGRSLRKISGTEYLRTLLRHTKFRSAADTLWLVATESAK